MSENEIPEAVESSKLSRLKTKFEENKTVVVAVTGFAAGIAATLWCIEIPKYDPSMPIPGLLVDEDSIKRDIVAGIIAVEFFKKKGLVDEFVEYADKRVAEGIASIKK